MNPIGRNVVAVIAGLVVGSVVKMGLIMISPSVIAPPEGMNVSDAESLKVSMHLFSPRHFILPFLAHALGTLGGAWVAALLAASHKMGFALAIGAVFLIGGIMSVFMLPAPSWFIVLDLVAAYIPMGWLGGFLNRAKPG